jgi:hypothetical protein
VLVRGQQRSFRIIGSLSIGSPEPWTSLIAGFLDALKEAAFVEAPQFD